MAICFLFVQHLHEDGCLSLKLDQKGQVLAALAQRNFAEIKTLQANSQTYLIAAGQHFSLHQLELPWLADRKARAAIPFALEDKLAQNFDTLHFAFDKNHYQAGHYLVVVADQTYLQELIAAFDRQAIPFNRLTIDWFALHFKEIALTETALLVNNNHFQGGCTPDLIPLYLEKGAREEAIYCFKDSDKTKLGSSSAPIIEIQESSYLWLAKRLQQSDPMNLCQGELEQRSGHIKTKGFYQIALAMTLLWLLTVIAVNTIKLYWLNKDMTAVDAQIAHIYREFFPQAKQIISPKFQLSQLIKAKQGNIDLSFWLLLNKSAPLLQGSAVTLEQLRFQNQTLTLTLITKNFSALAELQNKLQQNKVKVKQAQASTRDEQVVGVLELSL